MPTKQQLIFALARNVTRRPQLQRDIRKQVRRIIKLGAPVVGHWTGGEQYKRLLNEWRKLNHLLEQV